MLLGQFLPPTGMDGEKFVRDAADEIDIKLGFIYKTPIKAKDGETLPRPVSLLLKRISVYISTARFIMAATGVSTDDNDVSPYARRLLAEAHVALDAIANERTVLEGAERLPEAGADTRGPRISNVDSYSQVDAFYSNFTGGTHDMFVPDPWAALRGVDSHNG